MGFSEVENSAVYPLFLQTFLPLSLDGADWGSSYDVVRQSATLLTKFSDQVFFDLLWECMTPARELLKLPWDYLNSQKYSIG